MSAVMHGTGTLYRRRLSVTTKTLSGTIGTTVLPVLWILVIAPALDKALGGFNPNIDYYTYLAVAQITFVVPFTAMFNGLNVILDRQFGITRELLVAPIARGVIPIANSAAVTTIALFQTALVIGLAILRGANFTARWNTFILIPLVVILLASAVYGVAEILALKVNRQEAYGPLIAAVGVAPWFISGTLFPPTALATVPQALSRFLPWTHAVSVLRYGLMNVKASGLGNIWGFGTATQKALMSLGYLGVCGAVSLAIAAKVFRKVMQQ
jgi:ABC-2 type transport system permease protein